MFQRVSSEWNVDKLLRQRKPWEGACGPLSPITITKPPRHHFDSFGQPKSSDREAKSMAPTLALLTEEGVPSVSWADSAQLT